MSLLRGVIPGSQFSEKHETAGSGDALSKSGDSSSPAIDRTVKLYIGGKQARPDSGYSMEVRAADGRLLGEAPLGNRKDIRNAVEAARKASGWAKATAHTRAQVLYYCAENLSQRRAEIGGRLAEVVGDRQAAAEVEMGIERIFSYAAWADKFDGAVHNPPFRNIAIAMNEAIGTVGVICPREAPLLGISFDGDAIARDGEYCYCGPFGDLSSYCWRLIPVIRYERLAGRRGESYYGVCFAAFEAFGRA